MTTPNVPVFGRRSDTVEAPSTRVFALEVETVKPRERFDVQFTAYLDADAGALLAVMSQGDDEMRAAQAYAALLGGSLVDDDGVEFGWYPTPVLLDSPAPGVPGQQKTTEAGEPLWLWHDGTEVTAEEMTDFDELRDGSSRRRFSYVMDSANHRVKSSALQEVSEYLISEGSGRPTKLPVPSRPGPSATGRGSGGRRR